MSNEVIAGRFVVVRPLASGGMGDVFIARQIGLEREVALKRIRADRLSPALRDRFRREARALGALRHVNVVDVYDFGEDDDGLYLAMELLRGGSLAARLRGGRVPLSEALQLVEGICDGLSAVHAAGVIHRDLKPDNVVVEAGVPRLVDFGLARRADSTDDRITESGAVHGTPGYLAPEVILGAEADVRADLYAVGALLFELIAGKPTFTAATSAAVLSKQLTEPAPHLDVGGDVDALVQRLLSRDPAERPSSAAEVAARCRALRAPPPTEAHATPPPSSPPMTTPPSSSPTTTPPPPAPSTTATRATTAPPPTAPTRPPQRWPLVAGGVVVVVVALALLLPSGARVELRSTPSGARVDVDGVGRGITPAVLDGVRAGRHDVRLSLDGHRAVVGTFSSGDEDVALDFALAPDLPRVWSDDDVRAFRRAKALDDEAQMFALAQRPSTPRPRRLESAWRDAALPDPAARERARAAFVVAANDDDARAEACRGLAGLAFGDGRFDEAIARYDDAKDADPDDAVTAYLAAAARAAAGDVDAALDGLEAVVGVVPLLWLREDPDLRALHGLPRFEKLLARTPSAAAPTTTPPTTTSTSTPTSTTTTTTTWRTPAQQRAMEGAERVKAVGLLQEGNALLRQGQRTAAREKFLAAVAADARFADAHDAVGFSFHLERRYAEALPWFEQALALDRFETDTLYNLACLHALNGRPEEAVAFLERATHAGAYVGLLLQDRELAAVHDDPRVRALLEPKAVVVDVDGPGVDDVVQLLAVRPAVRVDRGQAKQGAASSLLSVSTTMESWGLANLLDGADVAAGVVEVIELTPSRVRVRVRSR